MRPIFGVLCALLLPTVSVCAQAETRVARAVPVNPVKSATPIPVAKAGVAGALPEQGSVLLRPNDIFDLRLSGMPPEDAQQFGGAPYNVGSDGTASFPLIGRVVAAGLSPSQLERAIEKKLVDEKIFRWPNATINVMQTARFVMIGGNVRGPNRSQWSADLTLKGALDLAGGPSEFAGSKVVLIRGGQTFTYKIKDISNDPSKDPKLLPGDRVDMK